MFMAFVIVIATIILCEIQRHNKFCRLIEDLFRRGRSKLFVLNYLYNLGYNEEKILNGINRYLENSLIEREKVILTRKNDYDFNYYKRKEK